MTLDRIFEHRRSDESPQEVRQTTTVESAKSSSSRLRSFFPRWSVADAVPLAMGPLASTIAMVPAMVVPRYREARQEMLYRSHREEIQIKRIKTWLPSLVLLVFLFFLQLGTEFDTVTLASGVAVFPVLVLFLVFWARLWCNPNAGRYYHRIVFCSFLYLAVFISFSPDRLAALLQLKSDSWQPKPYMESKCISRLSVMFMVSALLAELPPGQFLLLMHLTVAVYLCCVMFFGSLEYSVMSRVSGVKIDAFWAHGMMAFELYCTGALAYAASHRSEVRNRKRFDELFKAKQQVEGHVKIAVEKQREQERLATLALLEDALWNADELQASQVRCELAHGDWAEDASLEATARILRTQSKTAGVSVAYLLSAEFLALAQKRTRQDDPTFYDLRDKFFFGAKPVGKASICPRDGKPGCALIDTLPRHYRRASTHFLSWTWGYTVTQVRGALEHWIWQSGLKAEQTFLFMCFFTNNQYRILVDGGVSGSSDLEIVFEENLRRIGRVVALLDHWDEPMYLKRIWTIFEQFTAVKIGIEVDMILPPSSREALIEEIYKGEEGILHVKRCLCNVHSQDAKATMPEDECKIKSLIESTIGFHAVDEKVRHFLVEWVAKTVGGLIDQLINEQKDTLMTQYSLARGFTICAHKLTDGTRCLSDGTRSSLTELAFTPREVPCEESSVGVRTLSMSLPPLPSEDTDRSYEFLLETKLAPRNDVVVEIEDVGDAASSASACGCIAAFRS